MWPEPLLPGDPAIKFIADLVYENCGIVFKDSNLSVLISRLTTKLKEKEVDSRRYLALLKEDKNELASFIDFVTTNFTSFFRNPRHFEILSEVVLPELEKRNSSSRSIKIWSAGCATGEEPYSIMMVVYHYFNRHNLFASGWNFSVIASDISLESLFTAKEAKFPERSVQKIEKPYLDKYFMEIDNSFLVKEEYKKWVKFDYHNLIYDNGIRDIDITFCRNVLIYFDEDVQKKVMSNIYLSMKEDGFLFLGHSESLIGLFEGYKPFSTEKGIIYVKQ